MTLLLGGIAGLLLLAIVVAVVRSTNQKDETLQFTRPDELAQAAREASGPTSPPARPLMGGSEVRQRSGAGARPGSGAAGADHAYEEQLRQRYGLTGDTFTLDAFYPGNLGVGTTLRYRGVDSKIIGVLSFDHEGELWQDYMAEHAEDQWWLFAVEPDRGMRLLAFEPRDLGLTPGPDVIEYDGDSYRLVESGPANYRSAGQTGRSERGTYAYFLYESNARTVLSFDRFDDGPWTSSIGHHVDPRSVEVCNLPTD